MAYFPYISIPQLQVLPGLAAKITQPPTIHTNRPNMEKQKQGGFQKQTHSRKKKNLVSKSIQKHLRNHLPRLLRSPTFFVSFRSEAPRLGRLGAGRAALWARWARVDGGEGGGDLCGESVAGRMGWDGMMGWCPKSSKMSFC